MSTYTLLTPVTVAGKTYTALTFRAPKGADLVRIERAAKDGMAAAEIATIAALADVPFAVGEEMTLPDIEGASAVVAPFFPQKSTPTGG